MKIAMLLDTAGRPVRPESEGTVYVYERHGNDWVVARTRVHAPAAHDTIAAMRAYLTELCAWLDDCTVLAAQPPRGFSRVVFAQQGVDLWAVDGEPKNYLDQIAAGYGRKKGVVITRARSAAHAR
jgi:hypothetical protein